jgi:hypothetical protein
MAETPRSSDRQSAETPPGRPSDLSARATGTARAEVRPGSRFEREETENAAAEAAQIGGAIGEQDPDPAQRPVAEAGGGEAEGFELATQALIEHASHGDQQSAHAVLHHASPSEEENASRQDAEADHEHSSELDAHSDAAQPAGGSDAR